MSLFLRLLPRRRFLSISLKRLPSLLPFSLLPVSLSARSLYTVVDLQRMLEEKDKELNGMTRLVYSVRMQAMSGGSAATSASRVDELRMGAPKPTLVSADEILQGFPHPDAALVDAAWARFLANRPPAPTVPLPSRSRERRGVHPYIHTLLHALVPRGASLRVWKEERTPDDAVGAHVNPDFTLTDARDALPSLLGAHVCVEVKLPGNLDDGEYQSRVYMRRRMFKLCCEAEERGECLNGIFVLGVAMDGHQVTLIRMTSGAPPPGVSFRDAWPCPVVQTPPLPLHLFPPLHELGGRGGKAGKGGKADFPSSFPPPTPAGLLPLIRLLSAPMSLYGDHGGPLSTLTLSLADPLQWEGKWGVGGQESKVAWQVGGRGHRVESVTLHERLGCGGTSDVYSCGGGDAGDILKVARFAAITVAKSFEQERLALTALQEGSPAVFLGLVPQVLAFGSRVQEKKSMTGSPEDLPWPVLHLHPRGESIERWVGRCVSESPGGGAEGRGKEVIAAPVPLRRQRAASTAIVGRVLGALSAAHALGWVHCDVRPSNIVGVEGKGAMLVDWGAAARVGKEARKGVAAYSDPRVFMGGAGGKTHPAMPAVDAVGALYTWLAVAYGKDCRAPWLDLPEGDDLVLFAHRRKWVEKLARRDPAVARVRLVLQRLESEEWSERGGEDPLAAAAAAIGAPWPWTHP